MPGDPKRSILSDLKRPLIEPVTPTPKELEERLLGIQEKPPAVPPSLQDQRGTNGRVPTVPVTFHLPVELRDKLKLTAQAKQLTMVEIATEALRAYLDNNPVSEQDLRRMLGM